MKRDSSEASITGAFFVLLSGLLCCGDCGNAMTGRKAKNWGKYVYEYTCLRTPRD
ncbi:zinc ribbon domain-containing protein [Bacillus sp. EB600]|nr:zinc ribbon domain-containing protein [Bacillus sp. EB600]